MEIFKAKPTVLGYVVSSLESHIIIMGDYVKTQILISNINCEDKAKLSLLFHIGEKIDAKNKNYMYLKKNHQCTGGKSKGNGENHIHDFQLQLSTRL
jgi:hypothetical protein